MIYKTEDVFVEITHDNMNFIVEFKKINDDPESKKYGQIVNDGVRTFHSSAGSMARKINDKIMADAINKNIENLTEFTEKAIAKLKVSKPFNEEN
jgi:hypothetical protein